MLGNETFNLKKFVKSEDIEGLRYDNIYNCYDRPSGTKVNIYNHYYDLLNENTDEVIKYGVGGYNCFMFTINAIVKIDGVNYYVYITKTRNEMHIIKDYDELNDDELEKNFITYENL